MHSVTFIPRHLTEKLASTLRTTRVINIVGPRQTGKTTLVRDMVEADQHCIDRFKCCCDG